MTASEAYKRSFNKDSSSNIPLYDLLATGMVPEFLIRAGIKNMLGQKLRELHCKSPEIAAEKLSRFVDELKSSPIAINTDAANQQHYEVPPAFFENVLGPNLKYSCCLWEDGDDLAAAEKRMLNLTCERAELADGQRILELGCGWGSLSLFMAAKYKNVQITAVSNSAPQRMFIENKIRERGISNVKVITSDINDFSISEKFDRVVSVEMFEHAKNYQLLLKRIASWLQPEGKLFVHIFSHIKYAYHYDSTDPNDWLTKYFFTGGTMPADSLLLYFADDMAIEKHWCVSGIHYEKTSNAWLENMSRNESKVRAIISDTYGADQARRWWVYWRLFFLACAELWGYKDGSEWMVSHYLFSNKSKY